MAKRPILLREPANPDSVRLRARFAGF